MTVGEKLIEKLTAVHPTKKFSTVMMLDPISFEPWTQITCNGLATPYGLFESLLKEEKDVDGWLDRWVLINGPRFTHY